MRLRRTHYALAVVVMATALAADRNATAAPETVEPGTPSLARTLAAKLTGSLRRSVQAPSIRPVRRDEQAALPRLRIREGASGYRAQFSVFEFRLPPPVL